MPFRKHKNDTRVGEREIWGEGEEAESNREKRYKNRKRPRCLTSQRVNTFSSLAKTVWHNFSLVLTDATSSSLLILLLPYHSLAKLIKLIKKLFIILHLYFIFLPFPSFLTLFLHLTPGILHNFIIWRVLWFAPTDSRQT